VVHVTPVPLIDEILLALGFWKQATRRVPHEVLIWSSLASPAFLRESVELLSLMWSEIGHYFNVHLLVFATVDNVMLIRHEVGRVGKVGQVLMRFVLVMCLTE
jgi:hypothetical protein